MARYRRTAIAALAASALLLLLLLPTAAYADHNHHGVSTTSDDRGMSWGYYSGEVKDYEPDADLTKYPKVKPDIFEDASASAVMIGMDGRSFFRLRVTGTDAKDGIYGVHLHQGTCDAESFDAAQGHYNVAWNHLADLRDREVWLDLDVNSDGYARSTATVDFIPEGDRSIVLHALPTADDGTAGPRLACLPFNIKVYGD